VAKKSTKRKVIVHLNTGDDIKNESIYLTVTGTSAEMGDDGSVGRGNRCNGLITPNRPMSMEATSGKNPINHIGKIYNLLSTQIATECVAQVEGIEEMYIRLLSQIGQPIDRPLVASVQVLPMSGVRMQKIQGEIEGIVDQSLENVTDITERVIRGELKTFRIPMAKQEKNGRKNRTPPSFSAIVRLAIPNKGRIAAPIMDLIEKSGLHVPEFGERRLITKTLDPHVEILFARPVDIPEYVATGAADIGITGRDMVVERESEVDDLLDLESGKAKLVLAVHEDSPVTSVQQLEGLKVATEFPVITREYFAKNKVNINVVLVGGACEATPHLGIADAIIDLSSSGTTLKTNRLRVIDVVMETSTHLIANKESLRTKKGKIDEIHLALESVIRARGQCYLMMNVRRSSLEAVQRLLPGLSGPTVMEVASSENLVAVHAVVNEERVYSLINSLKRAGAKDILVMAIQRMIS
jgi:ATP phosphoribosyltransferase